MPIIRRREFYEEERRLRAFFEARDEEVCALVKEMEGASGGERAQEFAARLEKIRSKKY